MTAKLAVSPDRPTLLMVHGIIGSLAYFDPASRIRGANVHTLDLLGYGAMRDIPRERLTLASQTDHVIEHVDRIGDRTARAPVWLLGHSMGGAIVMLLADRFPERVAGIINVEGNFTLKDAFWSRRIANLSEERWAREFAVMDAGPAGWLDRCGIDATDRTVGFARSVIAHQPASTLHAMSKAILDETGNPAYLDAVRRVVDRGIPIHLIAGERSAAGWDVPDFVRTAARSYREQPATGHIMMLEDPDAFCDLVDQAITQP